MIEVLGIEEPKEEIEITPELALAAARVLKAFCKRRVHCEGCVVRNPICKRYLDKPCEWEIPEREV